MRNLSLLELNSVSGGLSYNNILDRAARYGSAVGSLGLATLSGYASISITGSYLFAPFAIVAGAYGGFFGGILGGVIVGLPIATVFGE